MWHLTKLALRNRLVTLAIVIMIAGASIWAILGLKMELIPDIDFPYATVITVYPQASPDQVAAKVSTPIEQVISDNWEGKGLKHVTSTSADSISVVMAEFEYGTNMKQVTNSITQGISKLNLPQEVAAYSSINPAMGENPRVIPLNMSMLPLVTLSVSGDLPPDQLRQIADNQIVPLLSQVKGVVNVEAEGGEQDQVIVAPDPSKMTQYGVSMSQIAGLIASQSNSISDLENTVLASGVTLGDVASVGEGTPPMAVVTRTNGQASVTISVMKNSSANTVDVANAVVAKATSLNSSLPDKVTVAPIFDQSNFIESSISSLLQKALIGCVLAIIVVFLFLAAIRASLVTAISIPLSMFVGFLVMRLSGITINLLTLSAMSIAVGRLIDDSIVMVEVLYRRLQQGEGFREAAVNGAKEIANPITSATLATVAIFLPLMFVGGIVGQLFVPFALTVTFAMLASLAVALMVVPTLSNFLVGGKAKVKKEKSWYQRLYVPSLKWALGHRGIVLVVAGLLFVGSLGLVPIVGTSFMSGMSEKSLTISVQLPPGTDNRVTSATAAQVESLLVGNKAITNYYTTVGTSASLTGAFNASMGAGDNTAQIMAYLDPHADMDKEAVLLREEVRQVNGGQGIAVSTSDSSSGFGFSGLEVNVQGSNQADIATVTGQLMDKLNGVKGLANLENNLTTVVPKLDVQLDPAKVASLGLSTSQTQQLQQDFALLMAGSSVPGKTVNINETSYPVFIKGVSSGLTSVSEASALPIGWPQAATLDKVADVALTDVPTHISHTDLERSATINAAITDKNVGGVNSEVQSAIDSLPSHPGVTVKIGGVAEEMSSTFSNMIIAILAAIVIAYVIVALMTRSFLNPLIIMASLPLASIGAMLALVISGHTIGVSAMMGILMLVGIVLTNAIVLIALVEQLRKKGMSVNDALVEGGQTRLRPILMTALTTIFAMIPLAIGAESGTLIAAELAVVVIGGLFSSTLLTLFVIPVIYSLVGGWRERRRAA